MLLAIADFWQRVAPLFAAVSSQKDEIATLRNNLRAVKEERARVGQDYREAKQLACKAIETADRARHKVIALREENDKLKRQMEAQRQEHVKQLAEEASEKTSLRDTILAHKHKEAKQKAKIEALRKELAEHGLTISSLRQSVTRMQSCSGSSQSQSHSQISTAMPDSQISRFREPYSGAGEDNELILDSQSQVDVDDLYAEPEPEPELPHTARVSAPQSQSAMPQRPIFGADWNLPPERTKRKRTASVDHRPREAAFPIALDGKGRPKGIVQLGSRQRHK
ncbi:hypothetical protein WOLCODRAFT_28448 [Wolfiporia cocos MD-104 SS10]|uniref:Uncharacterized protein n=1 Tax=Wolfiporia cocos (strain MD-104) TaxID=742152 RepID=A0A2H3J3L8_WOLCO|nr:hypothetical protein WOLCODRAFT_28448 [Wolfiporia cocos MD-104 SS10]